MKLPPRREHGREVTDLASRIARTTAGAALAAMMLGMLAGCVPYAEVEEPEEPVDEEPEPEVPAAAGEIVGSFWDAFAGGDRDGMESRLSQELADKMEFELILPPLAAEYHIDFESVVFAGFEELSVSTEAKWEDDRLRVWAMVKHPRVPQGDVDAFAGAVKEEVRAAAGEDRHVEFDRLFSRLLGEWDVPPGETAVEMLLAQKEETWIIVDMDSPLVLFTSFADLHREAVCGPMRSGLIALDQGEDLEPETPITLDFDGEEVTVYSGSAPRCALVVTTLRVSDEVDLSLGDVMEALSRYPFHWPELRGYLQMGPEDFLQRGTFSFDGGRTRLALTFTRPYAVATKDTAVGVADVSTGDIDVVTVIPGVADALAWSPDDRYLALAWMERGPGFVDAAVYDAHTGEEKVRLADALDEALPGSVEGIRWSDDSRFVEVSLRDQEDTAVTYRLDVIQGKLNPS